MTLTERLEIRVAKAEADLVDANIALKAATDQQLSREQQLEVIETRNICRAGLRNAVAALEASRRYPPLRVTTYKNRWIVEDA
jgi:hypothetical protein